MNNCCQDVAITPTLNARLIGNSLYITYNGVTMPVDLSPLVGDGGGGETPGGTPKTVIVNIASDGQSYFSNIIPINETLLEITVNGQTYYETTDVNTNGSYIITDRNITWTGAFSLEMTDTLILKTWLS